MAEEVGCARPLGAQMDNGQHENGETMMTEKQSVPVKARVGKAAPDFQAPAYYKGKFTSIKLGHFLGKWILLCFYPGDFTFV